MGRGQLQVCPVCCQVQICCFTRHSWLEDVISDPVQSAPCSEVGKCFTDTKQQNLSGKIQHCATGKLSTLTH